MWHLEHYYLYRYDTYGCFCYYCCCYCCDDVAVDVFVVTIEVIVAVIIVVTVDYRGWVDRTRRSYRSEWSRISEAVCREAHIRGGSQCVHILP